MSEKISINKEILEKLRDEIDDFLSIEIKSLQGLKVLFYEESDLGKQVNSEDWNNIATLIKLIADKFEEDLYKIWNLIIQLFPEENREKINQTAYQIASL
jgi:spore maturation protein CgeB